jgi:hypothetical protein
MANITIEINGLGGEFQHHFLNKKELKDILKIEKKGGVDAVVEEFFSGGRMFNESNYAGAYGCFTDAKIKVNGKQIKSPNITLEQKIDDKKPFADGGNLYYITKGQVSGVAEFEVNKAFDPKLLEFKYLDYEILEGWKAGKLISQVLYDGEEIFVDFSDDGQSYEHVGCIYKVDKKGSYKETDIFLMFDDDSDEWKFDADVITNCGLI